jgi:methyltransferase (TIGR00027 family)
MRDHPATQCVKRDRLASLGVILPEAVEFVPVDFEKEDIKGVLSNTSYKKDQLSFFSWLGVVGCLTEDAVYDTIASIAEISCPGSHLVFDFPNRTAYEQVSTNPAFKKFKKAIERKGEAGQSSFEPDDLISKVNNLGFEVIECLSPHEKDKRYFSGRIDGLIGFPFINYVHLRRGK